MMTMTIGAITERLNILVREKAKQNFVSLFLFLQQAA